MRLDLFTELQILLLNWICVALFLAALLIPIFFVVQRGVRGLSSGVGAFWGCMVVALFVATFAGEDFDLAPGCYLVGGWLFGLIYCLPVLILVMAWRAIWPNPHGYCPKCGRAIRPDRFCCPASAAWSVRGFEPILRK
jgi:hypothetical protein